MNWQDILLEQEFDKVTLRRAIAVVFELPTDHVSIVDSIEKAPSGVSVVVEQTLTKGDFRFLLSFYVVVELSSRDPIEVIQRLCTILDVRALIPDESLNPYSMFLIDQIGEVRQVFLDVESLDQHEEYRLSNEVLGHG